MLTAENICKQYKRRTVLDNLSFRAAGGEIIGIAGENGCGKSTLLNILTGIVKADSGEIKLEDESVSKAPRQLLRKLGYVPQDNSLFDHLNAEDNLKLWASAYKSDWKYALPFLFPEGEGRTEKEEREFLKKKPPQMSGGMRKRLSIALSLTHSPQYVIMDEPTAGLDINFSRSLAEMMKLMKARGQCVVFTSHHADELMLCDRLYVLRGGSFVYEGSPDGVLGGGASAKTGDVDTNADDADDAGIGVGATGLSTGADALYRVITGKC